MTYSEMLVHYFTALELTMIKMDDTSWFIAARRPELPATPKIEQKDSRTRPDNFLLVSKFVVASMSTGLHLLQLLHSGGTVCRLVPILRT